jgi:hypothetical protein
VFCHFYALLNFTRLYPLLRLHLLPHYTVHVSYTSVTVPSHHSTLCLNIIIVQMFRKRWSSSDDCSSCANSVASSLQFFLFCFWHSVTCLRNCCCSMQLLSMLCCDVNTCAECSLLSGLCFRHWTDRMQMFCRRCLNSIARRGQAVNIVCCYRSWCW